LQHALFYANISLLLPRIEARRRMEVTIVLAGGAELAGNAELGGGT